MFVVDYCKEMLQMCTTVNLLMTNDTVVQSYI